ncbi:unnamed protein product [Prorocentrum cordatum]|uniref:Uncharacterized protein n=1 Tax=Prorocentrum cordatum TaxID=2364126 RepID=A0ABN9Y1W5_9DINO|nr:unnamed protein product [Polarella glacialis]
MIFPFGGGGRPHWYPCRFQDLWSVDFVREACPEAAYMALLIRAEERLPARGADRPLLEFAALGGDFAGAASRLRSAAWPLAQGVGRLQRMAETLEVPEEYSTEFVMPYCDEPLDEEHWFHPQLPLRHVGLVLYRLLVCCPGGRAGGTVLHGDAALASLPPRAQRAAARFRSVEVVAVDASPQAWEVARYFLHLAGRYDRLADFTFFLHPDVFEHVNVRMLKSLLGSLRAGTLGRSGLGADSGSGWFQYLSLSHHYVTRPARMANPAQECGGLPGFHDLQRRLLGDAPEPGAEPGDFGFYCCSQFMVHRDRVLLRPREWYQRASEAVLWEHCTTSYMELLWHGIFNAGVLHDRKRQERPELPLFLRVDNFVEDNAAGAV